MQSKVIHPSIRMLSFLLISIVKLQPVNTMPYIFGCVWVGVGHWWSVLPSETSGIEGSWAPAPSLQGQRYSQARHGRHQGRSVESSLSVLAHDWTRAD